ncbi:DNA polymerase III subunit chi domain protein [Clostridium sp. KLE 1755]|nr:DNA polymerase III subunit chi domain protein [Clostridium sp. KLE 1755]
MCIRAILPLTSAATTLGLSRSPARRPGSCGVRTGGVPESFEKMELFLTASFSHSAPAPNGAV